MKIGDYVEKTRGFAANMKDMRGKSGLVVGLLTYKKTGGFNRVKKLEVLTGEGILELWIESFCEVVYEGR